MDAVRVLVVDDDASVLDVAKAILETLGYEVLTATSGEQALGILERGQRFDLVISDVRMPRMDGPELLRKVRRLDPTTHVALMSGEPGTETAKYSVPFIAKPFRARTFRLRIQEVLDA